MLTFALSFSHQCGIPSTQIYKVTEKQVNVTLKRKLSSLDKLSKSNFDYDTVSSDDEHAVFTWRKKELEHKRTKDTLANKSAELDGVRAELANKSAELDGVRAELVSAYAKFDLVRAMLVSAYAMLDRAHAKLDRAHEDLCISRGANL